MSSTHCSYLIPSYCTKKRQKACLTLYIVYDNIVYNDILIFNTKESSDVPTIEICGILSLESY